jgi:hypothetical protein
LSLSPLPATDDDLQVKRRPVSDTTWRGWATPGGGANKAVKSTRLASEAKVKSRLFPKTRSWFALGAPLELLSPLSVLRIVYALVLLAWPLTAAVAGTTSTNVIALTAVESVVFAVWFALLRVRDLGLRSCRIVMAVVALAVVALVASDAATSSPSSPWP